MDYGIILLKLVTGFAGLWLMTRLLGKKEIAQLTPFDFISAIIMSELVGETIYEKQYSYFMLLFALAVWTCLSYLFEKLTQHFKPLRKPLEGQAEILIQDGRIDYDKMRRNSLDLDQLRMMLRQKEIFSVRDVAFAIYETNGSLSIMKKSAHQSVECSDLNLSYEEIQLPRCLIENGKVQTEELASLGRDETWLLKQLQLKGLPGPESVGYAEWTEDGKLYVSS